MMLEKVSMLMLMMMNGALVLMLEKVLVLNSTLKGGS
jgi:hypothetical protein